jgi:hypothetical protein
MMTGGPRAALALMLGIMAGLVTPAPARALPSFAEQTNQPCAACHVGAFGPQLKPYGREFKLYGYTATDGKPHFPPVAAIATGSFSNTKADQPGGAARWFAPNNNFALDEVSLFYAGRITDSVGAFIEGNYDGVERKFSLGKTDIRHAREISLLQKDLVLGITVNNAPTLADLWNSVPAWGFPYNNSKLAPTPLAAAMIDGGTDGMAFGLGSYALWNDLIYAEFALYQPVGRDWRNTLGATPYAGANRISGAFPYWRLALQQQVGNHFFQLGTYGMRAAIWPSGDQSAQRTDTFTDLAIDANWQWIADPNSVVSDMLSAHATYIHETAALDASRVLVGSRSTSRLDVLRADVSYSIAATWTPTIQVFHAQGTRDAAYWSTLSGRPDSTGAIFELAWVPWGKPDSWTNRFNVRLAAQYVTYTEFNGTTRRASANNALYLSLWSALRF